MLPIKFADPSRLYSSGDLKTQLRLVVTNGSPSNSHGAHPPQQAVHEGNPFLNSYPDGERTAALTKVVGDLLFKGHPVDMVHQMALDWNARQSPPLDVDKVRHMQLLVQFRLALALGHLGICRLLRLLDE